MRLNFTKMHGAGNDFVVVDGRTTPAELSAVQARHLADRRRGVGCDQIMLLTPPAHDGADFGYRILNADGGEVQQCGNGARAIALFAFLRGGVDQDLLMESPAGPVRARVNGDEIQVDMGPARFEPDTLPLRADAAQTHYTLDLLDGPVTFGAVSMGNPHAVLTVDDVATAPVDRLGCELQQNPAFPESVNVGFMHIVNRATIDLRVNERGVGETKACGTGACAAAAVGVQRGDLNPVVQVRLPGGNLMVDCTQLDQAVWLTGPAHVAFEGHIDL